MRATFFLTLAIAACAAEPKTWSTDDLDSNDCSDGDNCGDSVIDFVETDSLPDTGNPPDTADDVDSGSDGYTDTDGDVDTEGDTNSEDDTENDGEHGTGGTDEDDTGYDSDTDSESELECPWECEVWDGSNDYTVCDVNFEAPSFVQNHNYTCADDRLFCCQPVGSTDEGALTQKCPFVCTVPINCVGAPLLTEYYCNYSSLYCCDRDG